MWEFIALTDSSNEVIEIQCVGINITTEIKTGQALRESEELYRLLAENSRDGISLHAPDGRFLYANPYREELTGYSADELMGLEVGNLPQLVHPDDLQRTRNEVHEQVKQGSAITSTEYRLRRKDGNYIWVETNSVPILDEEGNVRQILATTRDITGRKQTEQMAIENEHLRAQFQKEQDHYNLTVRFLSTFSHDIRNSLGVIFNARDMLALYIDRMDEDERMGYLDSIARHVELATNMLGDVLAVRHDLNHEHAFCPELTNLATLCRISVDEMRKDNMSHQLIFNKVCEPEFFDIDKILITRVLMNLLSNAIKYSPDEGNVLLEMDCDDGHVILRISDEGIGIPEQSIPNLFEPYFRDGSVENIKGTGLGLSIVKDCVEQHRGSILVESELGSGTTFTVKLPR